MQLLRFRWLALICAVAIGALAWAIVPSAAAPPNHKVYVPFVSKTEASRTSTNPSPAPTPTPGSSFTADQIYSRDLHNDVREKSGIAGLTLDAKLCAAARAHAQDMAAKDYFSHTGSDGSQPWDRMRRAGATTWTTAAENIGSGSGYGTSIDGIKRMIKANFDAMMAETPPNDGHRKNILNNRFRKIGVGVAAAPNGKLYWVCDFTD